MRKTKEILDKVTQNPIYLALAVFSALVLIALIIGLSESMEFVNSFGVFSLSTFLGYAVVAKIVPGVYTPLITATTAISGIVIVGCMDSMTKNKDDTSFFTSYALTGFIGIFFSCIAIVGSFRVKYFF